MRFCVQMSETEKDVKVALWYKELFTLLVSKSVCSFPVLEVSLSVESCENSESLWQASLVFLLPFCITRFKQNNCKHLNSVYSTGFVDTSRFSS